MSIVQAMARRHIKRLIAGIVNGILALVCAHHGVAEEVRPLTQLRVAYVAVHVMESLVPVTKGAGLFEKYGLDITLVRLAPNIAISGLIAGTVDMVDIGGQGAVLARNAGSPVVMVDAAITSPIFDFVVAPNIRRPDDLKGKVIASSPPGSLTDIVTRLILKNNFGLDAKTDVTFRYLSGTNTDRISALKTRVVDAALLDPTATPQVSPARALVTYKDLKGLRIISNAEVVTKNFATSKYDVLLRFQKAYAEGILLYKNKEKAPLVKDLLMGFLKTSDRSEVDLAYAIYSEEFRKYPTVEVSDVQKTIDAINDTGVVKVTVDPAALVDNTSLEELKSSGFLDRIWSGR